MTSGLSIRGLLSAAVLLLAGVLGAAPAWAGPPSVTSLAAPSPSFDIPITTFTAADIITTTATKPSAGYR
jgi:hypothetical protein